MTCVITRCGGKEYAVISRVTDDVWAEVVSEDRAREAWLGPTWWLGSVSMTRTTSLWRPELISHMEGICVGCAWLWLHSRGQPLQPSDSCLYVIPRCRDARYVDIKIPQNLQAKSQNVAYPHRETYWSRVRMWIVRIFQIFTASAVKINNVCKLLQLEQLLGTLPRPIQGLCPGTPDFHPLGLVSYSPQMRILGPTTG